DVNIKKIGQNIKYDYIILKRYGIEIKSIVFDTMIASYVLDPGRRSHGMDYLAEELLNYKTIHYKDIVVKGNTLLDVDFSTVVQYASEDADITFRLYEKFKPMIDSSSFKDLYYNVELPLITVLARIELNGVNINPDYFRKMSKEIDERLKYLEKEIWELSDRVFNINSTKQLGEVLFIKLGLKPKKKTKTGFSTDVSVLEELAEEHQVPFLLLEYRKLVKLKTAYLDSIPKLINKNTNRVHTSFNQTITQTGRLSSNNPNLQNIPIKEEVGRAIRKGFIAQDKNYIMSADYSQIELRILAHVSQDSKLIKAYKEDLDIHVQTASLIFRKPESEINNDERRIAKTINFSVIYGIGARKLAKDLKISTKLAKDFIDHYFREYAGVINYIEKQKKLCFEQGFVETIFHRIRYIPEIKSSNNRDRSFGERLAVNTPIQGTSADLIKMAMVNIDKELQEKKLKSMMTIQVHDELVFEVPENELGIMKELVVRNMESVAKLSIPLKVSISYGLNWDEAH
ncbi:MAG: DNA polymerase I, partial [Spirochaetota bacterium]|nr:DNA polymerase I [Spirochaetota bacterium]